ncbi:hypothetical protein ARMGADRAFT_1069201 [Armillaria gallica]|uniref:Uncharacterized protein n=1 Tax=Armillaria gallica TaxID=47427 RepID=A0A2H3CA99_ARMGA|nr:hypothetical protein ARMGADRAFT_1069201 [Armillaria gallica]
MCMTGRDGTRHRPAPTVRPQVLFALDMDSEKMETRGMCTVRDGLCDTIKRTASEPDAQVGRRDIHDFVLLMADKRGDAYMKLLLVTVVNYDDFTHLRAPTSTLAQHLRQHHRREALRAQSSNAVLTTKGGATRTKSFKRKLAYIMEEEYVDMDMEENEGQRKMQMTGELDTSDV